LAGASVVFGNVINLCDESDALGILVIKAVTAIGELNKISDFHFSLLFYMYIIAEILNCSRKK